MSAMAHNTLSHRWLNLPVKTHTVMGETLTGCDSTAPKPSINFSGIIEACPKSNDLFIDREKHIIFHCQRSFL